MSEILKVDNTMLSCFTTCPKKFYWRHIRHLVTDRGKVPALEFGKAIHKGLEVFYKEDSVDLALEAFKDDLDPEAQDDKRNEANGLKILKSYFKQYLPEKFKVLAVELNLSAKITPSLELWGYIDLVVEQQGNRYNVEHKTSSSIRSFIPNPNHQISGYDLLSTENGYPVGGSIVNILGVFKTKTENCRSITTRTDEQKESFLGYLKHTGGLIKDCKEKDFFPKYSSGCMTFNKPCPYLELCNADSSLVGKIIEYNYKTEEWTPWVVR